ncbi:methionine permease [Penicillium chermesinum]|nr:methionine permease [Penicillium chermesinum]
MPPVNEGGVPSHERQPLLEPRSNPTDRQVSSPTRIAPDYNGILPGGDTSKNLSWTSAYILVMSRVIGSGIFATPGSIVKSAGSVGLTLLVWLAGTILAACGLAVSLELGCLLPKSGGDKVYLEHAYPRPKYLASTLIAVHAVVLGFTASNCIVFAKYFTFAFSIEANDFQQKLLAVSLLTVITILHGFFLRPGIWIQNVLGWLKLFIVGIVSVTGAGIVVLRLFESNVEATPVSEPRGIVSWDTLWEGSNWSWSLLSTALFKVFYSYAGLTNVNNVMSEVKNPVRTLKTVCPTALLTSGALYFLANLSYLLVIPLDEIKNGGELVGALLFERVFGQHFGKTLFPLAIAICAGGT